MLNGLQNKQLNIEYKKPQSDVSTAISEMNASFSLRTDDRGGKRPWNSA
jgi:hypothetical protein